MTEGRAQEIIVLCLFITVASTAAAEIKGTKSGKKLHPARTTVGGFFAMLFCSIFAEFAPEAGAYLAVLVAGTAFFTHGLPVVETYYEKGKKV